MPSIRGLLAPTPSSALRARLPAKRFCEDQKILESNSAVPVYVITRKIPDVAKAQPEVRGKLHEVREVDVAVSIEVRIGGLRSDMRRHIPQDNRSVPTRTGENPPVRREQHGTNRTRVIPERGYRLTRVRVPQSNRRVIASAGKHSPVRRKCHGKSTGRMTSQAGLLPAAGHVPPMNVSKAGGERASIRRERQIRKSPHMPLQRRLLLTAGHIPQSNVFVAAGQGFSVRRKRHGIDKPRVSRQSTLLPKGDHVPQSDRRVIAPTGKRSPIRRKRQGVNPRRMPS